ncbi:MAG: GTPase Era, partial [Saprospiraceae bacterium]|nr:GTPase Era [Saprospiraceae bacterium]
MTNHRSGFVNIIGRPNVGKSTLLNAMVGERMSIISNKPQTTRHRIIGLLSGEDFQIVFSDTPGIIGKPSYKMHEAMNRFAHSTFDDADMMLLVTEPGEKFEATDPVLVKLEKVDVPKFLVLNKIDTQTPEKLEAWIAGWAGLATFDHVIPISALNKTNTDVLLQRIIETLPEGPAYYPKDQLTDRPERFF